MDDTAWREARDALVWAPYGIASLAATHWLDDSPRVFDGAPGTWRARDGAAQGDIDGHTVVLASGEELHQNGVLLRGFSRDGAVAVRVLDPLAARARGISRIERFPYDPAAIRLGTFRPVDDAPVTTESVDGHRSTATRDGVVAFDLLGTALELTVDRSPDGSLFAVFSDGTSGGESHRFRQLRLPAPDAEGAVTVDLNRTTLPPCAFSDHYVCLLPPVENRFTVPVRAGEALVR